MFRSLQIFPIMVDRQFRGPDEIKDNLFADRVSSHKTSQILRGIDFQRPSDYTITTRGRRPSYHRVQGVGKPFFAMTIVPTAPLVQNSSYVSKMSSVRQSTGILAQQYLQMFMGAIEWCGHSPPIHRKYSLAAKYPSTGFPNKYWVFLLALYDVFSE